MIGTLTRFFQNILVSSSPATNECSNIMKPKISCKIKWLYHDFYYYKGNIQRYLKTDWNCFNGLTPISIKLKGVGREVKKPPRNKKAWTRFPKKSNATICLKISKEKFVSNEMTYFDFWNIKTPKFRSGIHLFGDKITYRSKQPNFKRRMTKW